MNFGQRNFPQDITYWSPSDGVNTNAFGHVAVSAGQLIKGRWQDKVQQVRSANGDEVTSMAEVFVDRDISVGGYLALGDHVSNGTTLPETAKEIQAYATTPDLRNLATERRAFL